MPDKYEVCRECVGIKFTDLVIMIKIIMSINSFWMTTARTGSMWLYNVTREILKLSKINVLPIKIPKS